MSAPVRDVERVGDEAPSSPRPRWPSARWVVPAAVVGLVAVLVLVGVVLMFVFHGFEGRPVPSFASLAAHPDPTLEGTVAYYDSGSRCIRLVAAAGQPTKQVTCLAPWTPDPAKVEKEGKEIGPRLRWLADGRLEVTMLFMQVGQEHRGEPDAPGWQKIVDVRSGAVEDVPAADVPSVAPAESHPAVSPTGARVAWTSNQMTGRAKVTLTDAKGTRTLLSVHGPGEYTYQFGPVYWAPNGKWIAAFDDGRLLVITPTDPAVTRVLVHGDAFAITAANLLRASS